MKLANSSESHLEFAIILVKFGFAKYPQVFNKFNSSLL